MASASASVIQVDEEKIRAADQLCPAQRYERSFNRVDTHAGSYERKLQTKAGQVTLKVPRQRSLRLETQNIERFRRWESSVEHFAAVCGNPLVPHRSASSVDSSTRGEARMWSRRPRRT